jgi:hypothetical protein
MAFAHFWTLFGILSRRLAALCTQQLCVFVEREYFFERVYFWDEGQSDGIFGTQKTSWSGAPRVT